MFKFRQSLNNYVIKMRICLCHENKTDPILILKAMTSTTQNSLALLPFPIYRCFLMHQQQMTFENIVEKEIAWAISPMAKCFQTYLLYFHFPWFSMILSRLSEFKVVCCRLQIWRMWEMAWATKLSGQSCFASTPRPDTTYLKLTS